MFQTESSLGTTVPLPFGNQYVRFPDYLTLLVKCLRYGADRRVGAPGILLGGSSNCVHINSGELQAPTSREDETPPLAAKAAGALDEPRSVRLDPR